jgi:hypothetical protein
MSNWLIWCRARNQWWAPNSMGYVDSPQAAGRYTFEEAKAIVNDANKHLRYYDPPEEMMMPDTVEEDTKLGIPA